MKENAEESTAHSKVERTLSNGVGVGVHREHEARVDDRLVEGVLDKVAACLHSVSINNLSMNGMIPYQSFGRQQWPNSLS